MSKAHQYNSLGQILSNRGEVALGLAHWNRWPAPKIESFKANRFGILLPNEMESLESIAKRGSEVHERIILGPKGEPFDPDILPTNPYLFGDQSEGQRILLVTESINNATGRKFQERITYPDVISWDDALLQAIENLFAWADQYEEKAKKSGWESWSDVDVFIAFGEKRF